MRSPLTHPARVVPAAFALAALAGTLLLSLPLATSTGQRAEVLDAAFTSVSAVCVTGLVTVDTATYWSPFGQVVILSLVQVGGFGIMTLATLLVVLVGARLNLSSSLVAQAETRALNVGDVRDVVRRVAVTMLAFEAVLAGLLTLRFRVGYDHDWSQALWHGVFHSVTAFNNAGFALYRDNLVGFAADAWILLPICAGVIIGGIGFPVLFELRRRCRQPRSWSVHVRLTVYGSALLLVLGAVSFLALEWSNPGTLGPISPAGKLLGSLTGSVMPRTAGFNTVDYAAVTP
jgi:trk system potassium uptake protein